MDFPYTLSGRSATALPAASGRVYWLAGATTSYALQVKYPTDDGVQRVFGSWASIVSAAVVNNGDVVLIAPDFVTPPTAPQLLALELAGVSIYPGGQLNADGSFFENEPTKVLPATTTGSIFTVAGGRVELVQIIGEVTTVIQTQADNLKITNTPTVGTPVDLCSVLNVSALAVGTQLSITGTLATALQATNGAFVKQANSIILKPGTIDLITSATNTGSVKWKAIFKPFDPGAFLIAI